MRTSLEKSLEGYTPGAKIPQSPRAVRVTRVCTNGGAMDLVTLVERARGGDVGSFTELVQRHQRLAHGSAMAVVHDPDVAKDVAQEAFVAAWRSLPKLLDANKFP